MASVEKLPSGNYRGVAVWYDMNGKRKRKSFTDQSERRALRLAENFEEEKRAARPHGTTIAQALDAYIALMRPVRSPSTIKGYISSAESIKEHHARFCELCEVTEEDSQTFVTELLARGLSPKTVKNYSGLVSSACKAAKIPYEAPKLPRWDLPDSRIPSEGDMQRILDDVRGTRLEVPVMLGMFGLRRSEIAGLSPDDLEGNILYIHEARVYGENRELVTKTTTKTRTSTRTVQITDELADMIRERGIIEMSPSALSSAYKRVTVRLGVNLPFKSLRSFFASYCHTVLGLSDIQIQQMGGWSKSMIMRRHYIHSMQDQVAADAVTASFAAHFTRGAKRGAKSAQYVAETATSRGKKEENPKKNTAKAREKP